MMYISKLNVLRNPSEMKTKYVCYPELCQAYLFKVFLIHNKIHSIEHSLGNPILESYSVYHVNFIHVSTDHSMSKYNC